jgi:predicted DNA-binding protein
MGSEKVQTNLKLSPERAAALDFASAIEGKDKASIVEEALRLREELMGADYHELLEQALAYRMANDPQERLRAIETLRDAVPGATPGGSTSVEAALAKLRARSRSHR